MSIIINDQIVFTLGDGPVNFTLNQGAIQFTLSATANVTNARITEEGEYRLLEDGNYRLLE
jgi:hypothetical protein